MIVYNLLQTANQKFSTSINNSVFEFEFRTFRGVTYCNVSVNGELIQAGAKALPNKPIFCSAVKYLAGGDFMFVCLTDDYPHFSNFDGITVKFALV